MLVAVLLGGIAARDARADVVFDFVQVGPTSGTPGLRLSRGQMVVTDAAYASGFDVDLVNTPQSGPYFASLAGLVRLDLDFALNGISRLLVTLATLTDQQPFASGFFREFHFASAPGGLPSGELYYNNTASEVRLTADGQGGFTGQARSDGPLGCFFAACDFQGVVTVPEPAGLALFGLGALALGAARRGATGRAADLAGC